MLYRIAKVGHISIPWITLSLIFAWLCSLGAMQSVQAQVIPDSSLGNESSIVTPQATIDSVKEKLIEGGAIRGKNLFHSFSDFNVENGNAVYFASPNNIANIITRVTGNNISNILGTLGVDGVANLFLLNPQGIVFGENSSLNINGSFLGTTAESYIFANDFVYGAVNPTSPSLLTVNIPVGLQFGANKAQIINRSNYTDQSDTILGLNIFPQETLSLIGGEVLLEGGHLSTSKGNLEIGSVAPENRVKLLPHLNGWSFDYESVTHFENITVNNGGTIDGGTTGDSNIFLTGKNIALGYDLKSINKIGHELEDFFTLQPLPKIDQLPNDPVFIRANNTDSTIPSQISIAASDTFSLIQAQNLITKTLGTGNAGEINVTANSAVIYGGGFEGNTQENSSGNGAIVTFNADRMSVQNGGGGVNTSAAGNGGKINLNIVNDLKIQRGGFGADTFSSGNGGRIEINATNLEVVEGGAGVNTLGSGNGGTFDLNIANYLKIRRGGFGADTVSTGDGGSIEIDAKIVELKEAGIGVNARNIGKGGNIQMRAETIYLESGGISAESGQNLEDESFDVNNIQERFGQKNAGDGGVIEIEADSLFLNDEGKITTTTFGAGNAGVIKLKTNSLQLIGDSGTFISSSARASGNGGNIEISSNEIAISEEASIVANSSNIGDAGDISLEAQGVIQLQDQGKISVDGGIEGGSGNINLTANKIELSESASISAQVEVGNEGNIYLSANNLFLDNQSEITTNATNDSRGGNTFINLKDNMVTKAISKIVASAVQGRGGNIQIQTRGLFSSFNSQINANSKFGVDGTVQINTFDTHPNSGLIQLPDKPIDPSLYLTRGCGQNNNDSLVNIGRGGLSENPYDVMTNDIVLPDLETPRMTVKTHSQLNKESVSPDKLSANSDVVVNSSVLEAESWTINQKGNIEMVTVAQAPNINSVNVPYLCQN